MDYHQTQFERQALTRGFFIGVISALTVAAVVGVTTMFATAANAQEPQFKSSGSSSFTMPCVDEESGVRYLQKQELSLRRVYVPDDNRGIAGVWTNEQTQQFIITLTLPSGMICSFLGGNGIIEGDAPGGLDS